MKKWHVFVSGNRACCDVSQYPTNDLHVVKKNSKYLQVELIKLDIQRKAQREGRPAPSARLWKRFRRFEITAPPPLATASMQPCTREVDFEWVHIKTLNPRSTKIVNFCPLTVGPTFSNCTHYRLCGKVLPRSDEVARRFRAAKWTTKRHQATARGRPLTGE